MYRGENIDIMTPFLNNGLIQFQMMVESIYDERVKYCLIFISQSLYKIMDLSLVNKGIAQSR